MKLLITWYHTHMFGWMSGNDIIHILPESYCPIPRSSHTFCPLPHAALLGSSPPAALKPFCFASYVADISRPWWTAARSTTKNLLNSRRRSKKNHVRRSDPESHPRLTSDTTARVDAISAKITVVEWNIKLLNIKHQLWNSEGSSIQAHLFASSMKRFVRQFED